MDITPNSNNNNIKANESEFELASRVKPLAFTNGVLKRTNNNSSELSVPIVVHYRECLKNHAANLGGHALDGCGEFMPSPSATASDPTSLKCAACGCHRNFHRRDHDDSLPLTPRNAVIEYQPHHRHRPPPPSNGGAGSPSSLSPPPISSSYPASAPHMLLALSDGLLGPQNNHSAPIAQIRAHQSGRKRFRTKFTQQQKERMFGFAERVGWKIQKRDENEINDFCNEIGVDRGVLKVWMHNNKSTLGKRDTNNISSLTNNNGGIGNISYNINIGELEDQKQPPQLPQLPQQIINNTNNNLSSDSTGSPAVNVGTNGNASSSSS